MKYKLIQDLPDLKAGAIFEWSEQENCFKCEKSIWVSPYRYHCFSKGTVTQTPEFWEKVEEKEKNYEILSIYRPSDNKILSDKLNLEAWSEGHGKSFKIHSVKRLSDGEIFTVGDRISSNYSGNRTIESFELLKDDLRIWFNNGGLLLSSSKEWFVNKKLFTTEDGVDIYEGNVIFSINRINFQHYDCNRIVTSNFCKSSVYKYFSTKKAAENYIKCNKPLLSYKETINIFDKLNLDSLIRNEFKKELTKLVKSKLNG